MNQMTIDTPENIRARSDARAKKDQDRKDAMELVLLYAQDIVDSWPKMTLRTLGQMTGKIGALKEALTLLKV